MVDHKKGVLSSHGRALDFFARAVDSGLIWASCVLAHVVLAVEWTSKSSILCLLAIICFQINSALGGIYTSWRSQTSGALLQRLWLVILATFAALAVLAWLSREPHFVSRRLLLVYWALVSAASLMLFRLLVRAFLVTLRRHGRNIRRAAIVGMGESGLSLLRTFERSPWMGIVISGLYSTPLPEGEYSIGAAQITCKGDLHELITDARAGTIDHVYITLPMSQEAQIRDLVDELMDTTVSVYLVPDIFAFKLMNARQENIAGLPVISLVDGPLSVAGGILKRSCDIVLAVLALLLLLLPMLLIALAIKWTSHGSVIFRQHRYGIDGKAIAVWKFRTMTVQENGSVVLQACKDDPRLTRLGGFLRRYSLDELPQFFNVLFGSMSIVGPRPHAVAHNELYRSQIKGYMMRHKMKPGITGWAQVHGFRGETDTLDKMEKRIEYDLYYIRNWNVWLDAKIMLMTVVYGFKGKNVY